MIFVYAPNRRQVDSPFYEAKLAWYGKLTRWIDQGISPNTAAVIGGDFNVAPDDIDVWVPLACHGGTHVSEPEWQAFGRLQSAGLVMQINCITRSRAGTRGCDYREGNFIKMSACAHTAGHQH